MGGTIGNIPDGFGVGGEVDTIDEALQVLSGRRIAVVTGAGISTDSGIPDYRGEGASPRTPMTFQKFLASEHNRRRYWAGSHLGWHRFATAQPNIGHRSLAKLEAQGAVSGVLTQNVDSLHTRAGSRRVIELHGTMTRVLCLDCGQLYSRDAVAQRLLAANPWMNLPDEVALQPDGDVITQHLDDFVVPACTVCAGTLKPDVVFFGELIPKDRFHAAIDVIARSDALLIVGSSLAVNSGIRLLDQAARRQLPVVIVNRGKTKGDPRATVRVEGGTSEFLVKLANQ